MTIHVTFDPTDADDVAYVTNLLNGEETPTEVATAPAKKAAAKKAPAPEPEEEVEEETTDDGPTLEDAISLATELVAEGRTADIKGALATLGVKRVGELEPGQIADFIATLSEESVV